MSVQSQQQVVSLLEALASSDDLPQLNFGSASSQSRRASSRAERNFAFSSLSPCACAPAEFQAASIAYGCDCGGTTQTEVMATSQQAHFTSRQR